MNNGGGITIEI